MLEESFVVVSVIVEALKETFLRVKYYLQEKPINTVVFLTFPFVCFGTGFSEFSTSMLTVQV